MESGDDDESNTALNMENMTQGDVNRVIYGSELEWDNDDIETNMQSEKRKRRESYIEGQDQDPFILVTSGRKRRDRKESPSKELLEGHQTEQNQASYIEVSLSSRETLPKQIGMAKLLRSENIKGVSKVTYKSPYKILLRCEDSESADMLTSCSNFISKGWTCRRTNEVSHTYGVVKDVDLDIEDDQLKGEFQSNITITAAKRLNRRDRDGKWVRSERVRLCFVGSNLPPYVFSYGLRLEVEPYIFPVTQCSKCWRFGHIRNFCPSRNFVCPKCGGDHENCETLAFKCVNCKGEHMAVLKSVCPAYQREKKIREEMAQHNCTYKVAFSNINKRSTSQGKSVNEDPDASRDERIDQTDETIHPGGSRTYKEVLAAKKPVKKKMQAKKTSNNYSGGKKRQEQVTEDGIDSDMEETANSNGQPTQDKTNDKKSEQNGFFERFWRKMQEILFSKDDWMEKLIRAIKYILEEITVFLKEHINMDILLGLLNFQNNGQST
ncbi:uncharacterized protein [Choristoneura fumiferana]|uniref:uncharacterized protein n=1 Tax=Choristoneura fumiferana TaxID=7141 RepID=UPI003D158C13